LPPGHAGRRLATHGLRSRFNVGLVSIWRGGEGQASV
jgi:hypothetical protein